MHLQIRNEKQMIPYLNLSIKFYSSGLLLTSFGYSSSKLPTDGE